MIARTWLKAAAVAVGIACGASPGIAADNPFGECMMGYRCENTEWIGAGETWHQLPVDLPGALHWYQKSAAQGSPSGRAININEATNIPILTRPRRCKRNAMTKTNP